MPDGQTIAAYVMFQFAAFQGSVSEVCSIASIPILNIAEVSGGKGVLEDCLIILYAYVNTTHCIYMLQKVYMMQFNLPDAGSPFH